jgi:hypothetical protein
MASFKHFDPEALLSKDVQQVASPEPCTYNNDINFLFARHRH